MAGYEIYQFDGVDLPLYDKEHDLSTPVVPSMLAASVGGVYEVRTARRLPVSHSLVLTGVYSGETTYWVDHAGNNIVDHNGNHLIFGNDRQMLRAQMDALTGKVGVRGNLWRRREDATTVRQWKTARLLKVNYKNTYRDRLVLAEMTATFESAMNAWRSQSQTVTQTNLSTGTAVTLDVTNGGTVSIYDASLVITASGNISSVTVTGPGINWTWAGMLTDGQTLTVDDAAQTVRRNSTDVYSGFIRNAGHTALGWLPLAAGSTVLRVLADGPGTVAVRHYNQWM